MLKESISRYKLQNSNGLQMMDQQPESLPTYVRSWSDFRYSVPTTTDTYFPDSSRSILLMAPHNVEQAKVEFDGLHFQVETGSRHLGSFIGEATERESWIANNVDDWVNSSNSGHRLQEKEQ